MSQRKKKAYITTMISSETTQGSHVVLKVFKKYWISKLVFKALRKYWIWPKCTLCI